MMSEYMLVTKLEMVRCESVSLEPFVGIGDSISSKDIIPQS